MNRTITLSGRVIAYELERKAVKNINLRIRQDGSVRISANIRVPVGIIEDFMRRKSEFIISALDKYSEMAKNAPNAHKYVEGELFRYLGDNLRLVVVAGDNTVTSDGVNLTVSVVDTDNTELKAQLIDTWYNERCTEVFTEVVNAVYPMFQPYGIPLPKITVRTMTSRWGSCRPRRNAITLNKLLIEKPRKTIEYVVVHEFVHFLHPNHSAKFYETLTAFMPDWKVGLRLRD